MIEDPRWFAALAGALFLASLGMAAWAAGSQLRFMQRTRQLRRAIATLRAETRRGQYAAGAFRLSEARLRSLADALPVPVLYVDREQRCRLHNGAAARVSRVPGWRMDGALLSEVLGDAAHAELAPRLEQSLAGTALEHPLDWTAPFTVVHAPFPPGAAAPGGVYLVFLPQAAQAEDAPAADPRAVLARALHDDQFVLLQQRILPLAPGLAHPECYEVLLRLKEEEDSRLPPGGFVPLAESLGMMEQLDRWVVRALLEACRARRQRDGGWQPPLYWVSLARASLCSDAFQRAVERELRADGAGARSLCFELAGPDVVRHLRDAERLIQSLRPLGCRFAVDAFGNVRPSFADLRRLHVDFVKIDGMLVHHMLREPADLARVRAIHAGCRRIGARSIAELVEDTQTLEALREIGVDYARGFGIARPEPLFGQA